MAAFRTEPETARRGSIVVIAGRGETPEVYRRFARRIAFDGWTVLVVPGDLDAAASALAEADHGTPLVLAGSDTGALTALTLAAGREDLAGVVVAGLATPGATSAAEVWERELDTRSACPVHRRVLDAAVTPGALTVTPAELGAAVLAQLTVPVLAVHGTADQLSPAGVALDGLAALPDLRTVLVRGGRHDILNDVAHRSVAAEIVGFLEDLRVGERLLIRETAGALAP